MKKEGNATQRGANSYRRGDAGSIKNKFKFAVAWEADGLNLADEQAGKKEGTGVQE